MKAIHMIDDYSVLCEEAERIGKYEAYRNYTQKYPYFFQGVFRYLYCQPMENLRGMIERVDFHSLLQTAQDNYASGMADYAIASIHRFMEHMGVDFAFTFLLGLELSNIGGCATPSDMGQPQLYIGFDRPLSKAWMDMFIPHEMFHMLRGHMTQAGAAETVFSRTVEEGLASYASLWVHNLEWNCANIAKALSVSEKQVENLLGATEQLLAKLMADGDKPITPETMKAYFVAESTDVEYPVIGYYIGLYLARESVKKGVDFAQFASMPSGEIARMWFC